MAAKDRLIEQQRTVAYYLAIERNRNGLLPSPESDWDEAGNLIVGRLAAELAADGSPADWQRAREVYEWNVWADWADKTLRPYLAIGAVTHSDQLGKDLRSRAEQVAKRPPHVVFATVLDGAPEFSQAQYKKHASNGVDPAELAERKDCMFFDSVRHTLGLFDGTLLGAEAGVGITTPAKCRIFQDGCTAFFDGPDQEAAFCNAIAGALAVRRNLRELNEEQSLAWTDQLHARTVIGPSWDVLKWLATLKRDEILVEATLFEEMIPGLRTILLAEGIRIGCAVGHVPAPLGVCAGSQSNESR